MRRMTIDRTNATASPYSIENRQKRIATEIFGSCRRHQRREGPQSFRWSPATTSSTGYTTILEPQQAYFWTREWQRGEREADRDIRLGRTQRFASADEAIAWLKR